ncbi:MAG: hypothetical protein R2758_00700 [Bacteroidales bacterium]
MRYLRKWSMPFSTKALRTLPDIMLRRTGTEHPVTLAGQSQRRLPPVAAQLLGWDDMRKEAEIASIKKVYDLY